MTCQNDLKKHVVFLHTSPVHVDTFDRLVNAMDPTVTVGHLVMEELLADAQQLGAADPSLVTRVHDAMVQAAATGASIVVCTCSTIGGAAERTPTDGRFTAVRIDRAMADRAVKLGPKILVVAALDSTLAPTAALLEESAAAMGATAEIGYLVVAGAWSHFLRGDRAAYIDAVVAAVSTVAPDAADVIVLAQASMAPAAETLGGVGIEVLSSPSLGVQSIVARWHR